MTRLEWKMKNECEDWMNSRINPLIQVNGQLEWPIADSVRRLTGLHGRFPVWLGDWCNEFEILWTKGPLKLSCKTSTRINFASDSFYHRGYPFLSGSWTDKTSVYKDVQALLSAGKMLPYWSERIPEILKLYTHIIN